jgi:hypothetical protein
MIDRMSNKVLAVLFVTLMGGMACMCGGDEEKEESRWDKKSEPTTKVEKADKADKMGEEPTEEPDEEKVAEPEPEPVDGSSFNKSFPDDGVDGMSRTFTQEKEGFVEAKYAKGDDELVVTISDTASNPSARGKFSKAKDKLKGYPMMKQGSNGTVVLVKDRFQVKVTSKTVDEAGRKALLEQVKLSDLANMAN